MACWTCRTDWESSRDRTRAEVFDGVHPHCECEAAQLSDTSPIDPDEPVARLVFAPIAWDPGAGILIWAKLVLAYGAGLSFFRGHCRAEEVRAQVEKISTGGAEPQSLIGATVVRASELRKLGEPDRHFCLYDTEADEFSSHADLIGTWPAAASKTKAKLEREIRQKALRDKLQHNVVHATDTDQLILGLRAAGLALPD